MITDNFIYFGTPSVARDTLALLIENGFVPTLVVTAPDAPRGRGLVLTPCETKVLALEHSIPVFSSEKLDAEAISEITAQRSHYALVVAYGKIFPENLIEHFPKGVLNVHYSLLPKYRGAIPLEAALRAGEKETGVTIQKMVKALDAGPIVAQAAAPITLEETARELRPRLIRMGAELLVTTLPDYLSGSIQAVSQDEVQATHAGKLKKEDGLLSLSDDALENWNKYRAYADTIGTHFFLNAKRMKITQASFKNGAFIVERVIPEGKPEKAYVI